MATVTTAVEFEAMPIELELRFAGVLEDEGIEAGVGKLLDGAALAANEVVMMAARRELIADTAILEDNAAEDVVFLEQLHGAEDGGAAHARESSAEFFDGEWGR